MTPDEMTPESELERLFNEASDRCDLLRHPITDDLEEEE